MKTNYKVFMLAIFLCAPVFNFISTAQVEIPYPASFFDFEGADEALKDNGAATNNGEIIGTPTRGVDGITSADSETKGCIVMDGDGDSYLQIPYNDYLNAENQTVSMWIKYNSNEAWANYIFWTDGAEYPTADNGIQTERRLDVWTWGGADADKHGLVNQLDLDTSNEDEKIFKAYATTENFGSDFITDGAWHLITVSIIDNGALKMYVDGTLLVDETLAANLVENTKYADLWVGKRPPAGNAGLQANVDRLRIWDIALSDEQVAALFDYEGAEGGDPGKVTWIGGGTDISSTTIMKQGLSHYPNPTTGIVNFEFSLENNSNIELNIFDLSGKKVANVTNQEMTSGSQSIQFDASTLNSGMYIYTLKTNSNTTITNKMVIK